jgi:hypothetical protein
MHPQFLILRAGPYFFGWKMTYTQPPMLLKVGTEVSMPNLTTHPLLNDLVEEFRTRDFLISMKIAKNSDNFVKPKQSEEIAKLKLLISNYEKYYGLTFLKAVAQIKEFKFE